MKARIGGIAASIALVIAGLTAAAQPAGAFGSSFPAPSPPSVNAGGYMTCGVQPDLTAACWGDNISEGPGQSHPPAETRFLEVNAGYNTACGVTISRTIACWGSNTSGKVDNVPSGSFIHVAPGFNFVCALRTDSTPVCWGGNDAGQVSNMPANETFRELTVGIRHACGLRANGTVVCWGSNTYGQLTVPAGTYYSINSGNFTVCGIRASRDRPIECWGRNNGGQLTEVEGSYVQVSAGFAHVCALEPDRTITCWGRNSEGQAVAPAGTFVNVSAGTFHSCAMPTSGPPARCWGNNAAGRVQPSLSAAVPAGMVGVPYSKQLAMSTHLAPAPTFKLVTSALPPGVTMTPQGLLSGTPSAVGTYQFTVSAANAISPPDCPVGATGDFACMPGNPSSIATATRLITIVITAT